MDIYVQSGGQQLLNTLIYLVGNEQTLLMIIGGGLLGFFLFGMLIIYFVVRFQKNRISELRRNILFDRAIRMRNTVQNQYGKIEQTNDLLDAQNEQFKSKLNHVKNVQTKNKKLFKSFETKINKILEKRERQELEKRRKGGLTGRVSKLGRGLFNRSRRGIGRMFGGGEDEIVTNMNTNTLFTDQDYRLGINGCDLTTFSYLDRKHKNELWAFFKCSKPYSHVNIVSTNNQDTNGQIYNIRMKKNGKTYGLKYKSTPGGVLHSDNEHEIYFDKQNPVGDDFYIVQDGDKFSIFTYLNDTKLYLHFKKFKKDSLLETEIFKNAKIKYIPLLSPNKSSKFSINI